MARGVTDGGEYSVDESGTLTATGADGETEIELDLTSIPPVGVMSLP